MRTFYLKFLFLLLSISFFTKASVVAQNVQYGNEWINYGQPYYKIKVAKTGIHRISGANLTAAGITGVDPDKLQIFRRGKELAIYVKKTGSAADYIEFYGQRNDGVLDTVFYIKPSDKIHDYYSLYTDTATYFLTWGTANGKRMIERNSVPGSLTSETRHYTEILRIRTEWYYKGYVYGFVARAAMPWADIGESMASVGFEKSRKDTIGGLTFLDNTGRKPEIQYGILGEYFNTNRAKFLVKPPGQPERLLTNSATGSSGILSFPAWHFREPRFQVEYSDIHSSGILYSRIAITDSALTGTPNRVQLALSYLKIKYARLNNLEGKNRLILTDSTKTTDSYFLFDNPPANAVAYDISDPYNIIRTAGVSVGAKMGFVFQASASTRRILIVNAAAPLIPASIKNNPMVALASAGHTYDYIIITHPLLRKPVAGTASVDPPAEYAAYRASAAGGSYNPLLANIGQLYDQFHFGEKSPQAITYFMKYLRATGNPKYLLLMGKGIEQSIEVGGYRRNPNAAGYANRGLDLVPTAGDPPSDVLFTSDWKKKSFEPKVATGRVPAMDPAEVLGYLNKIKAHEALGVEDWRKNVLHLGGGQTQPEIRTFSQYLENYRDKIEGPYLGARVTSILRNSTNPVQTVNVSSQINAGLSLITFFGHSSSGISDLDIGFVSDPINGYNNQNKYPMILMNGCQSGNSFQLKSTSTKKYSFGEDWINTPDKGALLFVGNTYQVLPYALDNFSRHFYTVAFTDSVYYGKTIGEIHQETVRRAQKSTNSDLNIFAVLSETVLQGDPAARLFAPDKPDYLVRANGLRLQSNPPGSAVTATTPKFDIVIDIKNRGKAVKDSLSIRVKRTLPNSKVIFYPSVKYLPVFNEATYAYTMTGSPEGFGENTFEVILDSDSTIAEYDEHNNKASLKQFLTAAGAVALSPAEFSIVSSRDVKLVGQPSDLMIGKKDYYMELDTDVDFKSAFKKSQVVQNTLLPTWKVNLPSTDSTVYYWRIRFNDVPAGEDTIWSVSSFRYINNSPAGWSQSDYGQFSRDEMLGLRINPSSKNWEFKDIFRNIDLKTVGSAVRFTYPPYGIFFDNGAELKSCFNAGSAAPRLIFTIFNDKTLLPYTAMPATPGVTLCGEDNLKRMYFATVNNNNNYETVKEWIKLIPDGYYVAVISVNNVNFGALSPSQKDAFKLIGSQLIDNLVAGHPFALLGRKGIGTGPGTLILEKTSDPASPVAPLSQSVSISHTIQGSGSEGEVTSTLIGPATSWTTLVHQVNKTAADTYKIEVYGVDKDGNRSILPITVTGKSVSLSSVSATQYPYLQLVINKKDIPDRTPPQLKQWMVLYQPVPEGIIRPDLVSANEYKNLNQKAAQGNLNLNFAFSNISQYDFQDSLSVRRSVISGNTTVMTDIIKVKKLLKGDSVFFSFNVNTRSLKGDNIVRVEVNPRILPEQHYFNNYLELPFNVSNNNLKPVLDVAFDGVHIMDGDLVSPSPTITIALKDKDKQDYIKDPNNLLINIRYPGETDAREVKPGNPDLQVVGAGNSNQDAQDLVVKYNPKNLPDGVYTLYIQGLDNSGERSGVLSYTVNFEVINASTITHFYPYPNPFTSSTRFVFTVTGTTENIPRNMKVQVMTLTGKVVREIQKEELEANGALRIGNNMSAPWDGTDEYGDKLANGVYLYRVVMEKPPVEEMKHRRTNADKAFTKEYGKLYILR